MKTLQRALRLGGWEKRVLAGDDLEKEQRMCLFYTGDDVNTWNMGLRKCRGQKRTRTEFCRDQQAQGKPIPILYSPMIASCSCKFEIELAAIEVTGDLDVGQFELKMSLRADAAMVMMIGKSSFDVE